MTSVFPKRIIITTFNIWGQNFWPERSTSLVQTLQTIRSDIYLLQEVTKDILEFLDSSLSSYTRIHENKVGCTLLIFILFASMPVQDTN